MAIENFVPEVWSAELLVELEKSLVYGASGVVNRDYEGDISQYGDTVHITSLAEPTIGEYSPHEDITIEEVDDESQTLLIDQARYFAFTVDDIERRQARDGGAVLSEQARKSAYRLRDVADQFLASTMAAGVADENVLADALVADPGDAYDLLVEFGVRLDESNVPEQGRWVVIPPAFHGMLLRDTRFVGAGDESGAATRANGLVGTAAGFAIHKSNNTPTGESGRMVLAGYSGATTYAEQINNTEATRKERGFADIVKGLHLYGARVVRPTGLAAADVTIGQSS
ncbi:hypothetical protein [Nocardiopsis salina]|uniref:hypothetical protein n=1 Tax=Nocardiopsis salina TaxID=245836 RepID=UPI0003475F05|nr:hypothetical protein [Nocardiopsis salina]